MIFNNPRRHFALALAMSISLTEAVWAVYSAPNANNVLGQPNFTSGHGAPAGLTSQTGMRSAFGNPAYDAVHGRLFVADSGNNRVLVYNTATISDGMAAANVLGQSNFTNNQPNGGSVTPTARGFSEPAGVAYDSVNERLYVSDYNNNRVLMFDVHVVTDNMLASVVLGQSDFVTQTLWPTSQRSLSAPLDLAYEPSSQLLYVPDQNNNRVMIFSVANPTTNMLASFVLGAPDFTTTGGYCSANSLFNPVGVAFDSDSGHRRIFVADYLGDRVLIYEGALSNGKAATHVLGEKDLTTCMINGGAGMFAPTQNGLDHSYGILYDSINQRLFVADQTSSRVMVFDMSGAIVDNMEATYLMGQPKWGDGWTGHGGWQENGGSAGATQNGLATPSGVAIDFANSRIFVSDTHNNRVVVYGFNLAAPPPPPPCNAVTFVSGSATPATAKPGASITVACDYGVVSTDIQVDTGTCVAAGSTGTSYRFTCTAPGTYGLMHNECQMTNSSLGDNFCAQTNSVNDVSIQPTATFLQPAPSDITDQRITARVSNPDGDTFTTWQESLIRSGISAAAKTVAYPGSQSLAITQTDNNVNLIPNTSYTLTEQLNPAVLPGNFTVWTRPTAPGPLTAKSIGCTDAQLTFKNSADPVLANPGGSIYSVKLFESATLLNTTTVSSLTGLPYETLTVEFTGLVPTKTYTATVTALSRSGNSALDNATPVSIPAFSYAGNPSVCSQPTPVLDRIDIIPQNMIVLHGDTQQFRAVGYDQNGQSISLDPVTWAVVDSALNPTGAHTMSASGLFTAGNTDGGYFVTATNVTGGRTVVGLAAITVAPPGTPVPPTIASGPTADPNPTYTPYSQLNIEGATASAGGESSLSYHWTLVGPSTATVTFAGDNNSHTAKSTRVTFTDVGTYTFSATITDTVTNLSRPSELLLVQVLPRAASVSVTPKRAKIHLGETLPFTATGKDQFGKPIASAPHWGASSGGSMTSLGVLSVLSPIRTITVTAQMDSASDSGVVSVLAPGAAEEISGAHAYPVPWKSTMANAFITFTALAPDTHIRVYTADARLVKELYSTLGENVQWDLTNMDGERVASWVYLYRLENPSTQQTAKGKLVVIK